MGRPPLPVGTFGSISIRELGPKRHRARARFRDYDGRVRYVVRFGTSKTAATNALKGALADRSSAPVDGEIRGETKVCAVIDIWLEKVEVSDRSKSTKARYRTIAETFVRDGLGELRVRELNVPAVNRFIGSVRANHGAPTAKGAKTVVSGLVKLAMAYGALSVNPVRDSDSIPVPTTPARALTRDEAKRLTKMISADEDAIAYDLVDLCVFMLGTGTRIGEACGLREPQVDLDAGTIEVNATVTDFGLEERTKTASSWRVIAVPLGIVTMLRRRIEEPKINTDVVLFPSPLGRIRDTSNTAGDLRRVFDRAGFEWVSSHTFRKTVATRLDEAGMTARQIADHLGHAQVSMTQDVYMGRRAANAAAARALE
ncbi:tyrosine-type recombinase/integrase [Solicola gregarius]|uniref:Site-specific integrase n=1 Tax=Solicola gregarius TaxID=2908642 RepID=A0AA46TGQ1_9ACTN|nr:site-specific integrase [Solicola gregarius]UYM04223.1 site-specific integrase [Solicola gregarius]